VLCTSKTRSEVEYWRTLIGNADPFIVENGGATYLPEGCFNFAVPRSQRRGPYRIMQLGAEYAELVKALQQAATSVGCQVRGFHDMTVQEIAHLCQLSPQVAALAKEREFDEPFVILDRDKESDLVAAIEAVGKHCTRGGRFYHIVGDNDKAAAVRSLLELYHQIDPHLRTIGLGDGLNDAPFLNTVDLPILIRTSRLDQLQAAVPRGRPTTSPGPQGWSETITALFT
jgi:mannosyl-3-phosphoglycerate phosphatase